MTPAERFERIEASLVATAEGLKTTQALLGAIAESQARTQTVIAELAESVTRYVIASDARLKRLEENLDGLIRAITAEHSNGKNKL